MTGFGLAIALQVALSSQGAQPYTEAYKEASESGKPLVVLVTTDWCPGCVAMKQRVMPRLFSRGKMRNVTYSVVNAEQDAKLASKLMQGQSIPQLIVFTKTAEGWKREQFVGAQSEETVEAVIDRAVSRQIAGKPVAADEPVEMASTPDTSKVN
jgi:thioredoxin-like negative regulator of GroEL